MNKPDRPPILLIDDEPEILQSLKGLLRREFTLHTAESGEQALEILEREPIHVVMTDQRMPEMTGTQLMAKVKKKFPDAVRIIFTGYADIKAVVDAINTGGLYRYLTKPWDPDELVQVLHQAANEYVRLMEQKHLNRELHDFVCDGCRFADEMKTSGALPPAFEAFAARGQAIRERLAPFLDS